MAREDEQSLEKRSELNLEQLSRGGLIVGAEPAFRGSLIGVTGVALERITRERLGENPAFKLPERVVSFLDPSTRRLIIISNRENTSRREKTSDKFGLFAEIVELDEEGVPHSRLSTSELTLPGEDYQLVAIGPNQFNLPPSHIDVEEESKEPEKKRFVPWNVRLAELQNWMDQVTVDPNEDLDTFLSRFRELKSTAVRKAETQIGQAFPGGNQGFDGRVMPINLIITIQNQEELRTASIKAGLYPIIVTPDKIVEAISSTKQGIVFEEEPSLGHLLYPREGFNKPAIITVDERVAWSEFDPTLEDKLRSARQFFLIRFPEDNPVFAVVWLPTEDESENIKEEHGRYYSYNNEEYLGLLNKLKADLLLTMFLRGGASIVK